MCIRDRSKPTHLVNDASIWRRCLAHRPCCGLLVAAPMQRCPNRPSPPCCSHTQPTDTVTFEEEVLDYLLTATIIAAALFVPPFRIIIPTLSTSPSLPAYFLQKRYIQVLSNCGRNRRRNEIQVTKSRRNYKQLNQILQKKSCSLMVTGSWPVSYTHLHTSISLRNMEVK